MNDTYRLLVINLTLYEQEVETLNRMIRRLQLIEVTIPVISACNALRIIAIARKYKCDGILTDSAILAILAIKYKFNLITKQQYNEFKTIEPLKEKC